MFLPSFSRTNLLLDGTKRSLTPGEIGIVAEDRHFLTTYAPAGNALKVVFPTIGEMLVSEDDLQLKLGADDNAD